MERASVLEGFQRTKNCHPSAPCRRLSSLFPRGAASQARPPRPSGIPRHPARGKWCRLPIPVRNLRIELVEKIEIAMEPLCHQLPEIRIKHCLQLFLLGRFRSLGTDPLQILLGGGVFAIGSRNAGDIEQGSRGQIVRPAIAVGGFLSKFSSQPIDFARAEVSAIKENLDRTISIRSGVSGDCFCKRAICASIGERANSGVQPPDISKANNNSRKARKMVGRTAKATTLAGKITTARQSWPWPHIAANTIIRFDRDLLVLIRDLPGEDLSCRMENSALTTSSNYKQRTAMSSAISTSTHGQGR